MSTGRMEVGGADYSCLGVGSGGEFELSGGTLRTVWTSVAGTFVQSGGVQIDEGSFETVNSPDGAALYRMEGGELQAKILLIGLVDEGGGFEQYGGVVSAENLWLLLAGEADTSAVYTMWDGELNVSGVIDITRSNNGTGLFEQWGGAVTAGVVRVGEYGNAGRYAMHGGTLAGEIRVATDGVFELSGGQIDSTWTSVAGTFIQTGGVHIDHGDFLTINSADGGAVYRMEGGELEAKYLDIGIVGESGRMEQSGGSVSVVYLRLGDGACGQIESDSVYQMSGGTLRAEIEIAVGNGSGGSALFEQSGGSVTSLVWLNVGGAMEGTYRLLGGSVSAQVARVGFAGGTGVLEQSGGDAEMGGTFIGSGGMGSILVSGGSYVNTGDTWVGAAGTGELVVEGEGSYAEEGNMYVGDGWFGTPVEGSVSVDGGSVSVAGNLYVGCNGGSGSVVGTVDVGGVVVEG